MRTPGLRTAAVVSALTILAAVVAIAANESLGGSEAAPSAVREESGEGPTDARAPVADPLASLDGGRAEQADRSSRLDVPAWLGWAVAALLVPALIGAVVVLVRDVRRWLAVRHGPGPVVAEAAPGSEEADGDVARRAVDAALVPLRDPGDPRAAVIEAYVRMEDVLAQRDLARRSFEAPREYLGRVLSQQGMPAQSLATLTTLFEEARFSHHAIPAGAPDRARAELERTRDALGSQPRR